MDARPLKDVFSDLVGDPSAGADALAAAGHDLPADLVAEAVVSFAGTAPAEVAEHLAPFVTANSGVPGEGGAETGEWFELLATAPDPDEVEELDDGTVLGAAPTAHGATDELEFGAGADADDDADDAELDATADDLDEFDGTGTAVDHEPLVDDPALDLDEMADDVDEDGDDGDDLPDDLDG